jgi:dipeptidyl aminopeptidase/acylaminoacyl peptidase
MQSLRTLVLGFLLILPSAFLLGCATAPTQKNLFAAQQSAQLPPLVPMRRFVANVDRFGGFVISPDGQRLIWQQVVGLDVGLAVRDIGGAAVSTFGTGNQGRGGGMYTWLSDSRHFIYSKDPVGDENVQLFVQDAQQPLSPWAVTPGRGVRSHYLGRAAGGSARFFFSSNQRDPSTFDLYEADVQTRTVREIARSDGRVLSWLISRQREWAGRVRQLGREDGSDVAVELRQSDGSWRTFKTFGGFDFYQMHRLDTQTGKAWATSNIGRDKTALLEIDIATGQERELASHPQVDLSFAIFDASRGAPLGYVVDPDMPQMHYLDAALGQQVQAAVQKALASSALPAMPVITRPQNFSDDQQRVVLRSVGQFDSAELLLDRASGQVTRLNFHEAEAAQLLSPTEPFSFTASDGRRIHGYIMRPRGVQGPVPMVVDIHGGPWVRDYWAPATMGSRQMLTNRGYAVMLINYRGSAGYGREHMWAGANEYFGRLQTDIAEGVQWAIDQGIADSDKLAVLGGSFGGFSVLAQLIQKPHNYRCGVNIVGVADWPRLMDAWPPFWRNRHMFNRFYGDVRKPEERARMLASSPVSHLDKITAPLLVIHGANDIRVLRQDSDDVVAALRARNHPVEYLLFSDEGHSISKWRNRLAMWRSIEDTLATCLGGRSAGFDFYQLMPR